MDAIQKVLIERGRKDLAIEYYNKTSGKKKFSKIASATSNGLSSVPRKFSYLLVPMAQYVLTKYIKENPPIIASNVAFDKPVGVVDVQTDVNQSEPAINGITAFYNDKIITGFQNYDEFIVTAYSHTRESAKQWQDEFEYRLVTQNQYRGKSLYAENGEVVFSEIPNTNWDDVILDDKVKRDIRLNTVSFLSDKKLSGLGVAKRGLVMYGPPGTGKTSVVKAIFKELNNKDVSRIYVTAESFKRMSVGNLFDMLKYLGPSVLAFEDIDLVSGNRDTVHIGGSNLLGDLLTNLDGMRKHKEPIVIMASTNKIGMLDAALSDRPGRFDRRIEIGLPSPENLKQIYFRLIDSDVDGNVIKMSKDFTGSHVVETVNTAKILAANEGRSVQECLINACEIIRENFFAGQTQIQLQASVKDAIIKKGYKIRANHVHH